MPIPETLQKLATFLATTELLDPDDRGVFLRLIKRLTSEEDVDTKLSGWEALAVDASWFKAKAYEIHQAQLEKKENHRKKLFSGVDDKNTPKWQVEARLENDAEWLDLQRRVHIAAQLQIVADKVCEIAMQSLRALEARGNNARFYGRVEAQQ